MKIPRVCSLVLIVAAGLGPGSARLVAQDVTVTPLEWVETHDAPDEPPVFKKRPVVKFPAELGATPDIGYVVREFNLDEQGRFLNGAISSTQPLLQRTVTEAYGNSKFNPGRRKGQAVFTSTRAAVIFNPASAAENIPEATPRLLEVAVVKVKLPKGTKLGPGQSTPDRVVWVEVTVDLEGRIAAIKDAPPELAQPLEISAKNWRFAPARWGGVAVAVAAEVRVPFVVHTVGTDGKGSGRVAQQPRVKVQGGPVYPFAMRANGMIGEVLVDFVVDREGRVRNAFVARSLNPSFDDAAIDAVKQWIFEPGRNEDRPVNVHMQVPIIFSLDGHGSGPLEERGKRDLSKLPEAFRYDTPPKPVGTVRPVYPYALLRDEKKGRAAVAAVIGPGGRAVEVRVVEATAPEFGRALAAALECFVYEPALKGGRPSVALQRFAHEFSRDEQWALVGQEDLWLLEQERKKPQTIFALGELDAPLKPLSRRPPVYPVTAPKELNRGEALIEFLVDEEGRARLPRSVAATDEAFAYAAIQAIASWRFEPPQRGGRAVVARARVPLVFGPANMTTGAAPTTAEGEAAANVLK